MPPNSSSQSLGILFKVLNVLMAVIMLSLVRAMNDLPVTQVMFFRASFAIIPVALWFGWRGRLRTMFQTRRTLAHVRRTMVGMTCTGLIFIAARNLPLPEAVTLQYSQPLFVVAFSALFFGEHVRAFRWGAVLFGFAGVLVVSWPNLTLLTEPGTLSNAELVGVGAALAGSAGVATVLLLVGDLVRTETPETITAYTWLVSTLLLSLTIPFGWEPISPIQAGTLVLIGIVGGMVQLFIAISLKFAPASTTASFEYTSLIFATAIGFVIFGDIPGLNTVAGGLMVIAAGLAIIWRERRTDRFRSSEPQQLPPS